MRIGIVVEGHSEYYSLGAILDSLGRAYSHIVLRPVLASIQPNASFGVMARGCRSRLRLLESKNVDRIIVLIDREDREECPGEIAIGLAAELRGLVQVEVLVVVKDRCYENWLVADISALKTQPQRYTISGNTEARVVPNKADNIDALKLLKTTCSGHYDKVEDSKKIARHATVTRIASNSRSFRRLLRCLEHQTYQAQSRNP